MEEGLNLNLNEERLRCQSAKRGSKVGVHKFGVLSSRSVLRCLLLFLGMWQC